MRILIYPGAASLPTHRLEIWFCLGSSSHRAPGGRPPFYFVPMVAFAAGVLLAELIQKKYKRSPGLHWRQRTVLIEAAILLLSGFVPAGRLDSAVNVAISFVCAMQVESFRKIHGLSYATTMCTWQSAERNGKAVPILEEWGENTAVEQHKVLWYHNGFYCRSIFGCLATMRFRKKRFGVPVYFCWQLFSDASRDHAEGLCRPAWKRSHRIKEGRELRKRSRGNGGPISRQLVVVKNDVSDRDLRVGSGYAAHDKEETNGQNDAHG